MKFNYNALSDNDRISLSGCITKIKNLRNFSYVYLMVDDTIVETVYRPDFCAASISDLCEGAFITLYAAVKNQPRSDYGKDILITSFDILTAPYTLPQIPVYDKDLGLSFEDCMENKVAAMRNPNVRHIYKTVAAVQKAFSDFMESMDFVLINTPVITPETKGDTFNLKYFNDTVSLSSSAQMYLTPCTTAFGKVYSVSHLFMNKRYNSSRHLNEYITLDCQAGYINSLSDIISLTADCIEYIINSLSKNKVIEKPNYSNIEIIKFYDALKLLNKDNQADLDPTDIKRLCRHFEKQTDFVIVTDFPNSERAFYIEETSGNTLSCFDLYFKGAKIGTGSKNITDYLSAKKRLENMDFDNVYTQTIKYGIMPFGGFTIGLERLVMKLLNLSNIREASVFPRDVHHIKP